MRRDVKGGVPHRHATWRDLRAGHVGHFPGGPLFDRDAGAGRRVQVDRGPGRRHVKRNAVRVREDRHAVGPDLVGRVAVGGNAVGADDDHVHASGGHHRGGHVVGDHGSRDAVLHEFPGRQARALQERPRLVGKHLHALPRLDRTAHDPECRAVAGGGQRAGVAVRENARVVGHQHGAVTADRLAARHVVVVDGVGVSTEPRAQLVHALARTHTGRQRQLHALDRPEQIHGRGPRGRQHVGQPLEVDGKLLRAGGLAATGAQGQGHRGGNANRRGAPNHHGPDGLGHLGAGLATHVDLATRQLALVDHHDVVAVPGDGWKHGLYSSGWVRAARRREDIAPGPADYDCPVSNERSKGSGKRAASW